ncbi:MAG: general secretion pathway protein GspK [Myxococcota bacterium]
MSFFSKIHNIEKTDYSSPDFYRTENWSQNRINGQKGFALLIVTMSISILAVLLQVFVLRTSQELKEVQNQRDKLKAKYLSYSALEITRLFLKIQAKYFDSNPMLSGMGFDMGNILPMLMPMFLGGEDSLRELVDVDIEGLGLKPSQGNGGLETFESEDGKINVNCAVSSASVELLTTQLFSLFLSRRYDELFDRSNSNIDVLDRQQQVAAIIDFIDVDQSGMAVSGGDEDSYYKSRPHPYVSKNNVLDSNQEIRLIKGIDEIFWTNFGRSLTVYGSCQINLCAVDKDNWQLVAGIIMASAKNQADPVLSDPVKLKMLATTIAPQLMAICKDPSVFAQAVANPGVGGSLMSSALGMNADTMGDLGDDGVADAEVTGVDIDPTKLQKIIVNSPKRYYRIKTFGVVGKIRHLVDVVWDQQSMSMISGKQGSFVYWREY